MKKYLLKMMWMLKYIKRDCKEDNRSASDAS